MIYVYALADSDAKLEPLEGVGDSPIEVLVLSQCTAVTSRVPNVPEPDELNLRRHEDVIERVMQDASVIPLRFGQTVPDEGALKELVDGAAATVDDLLGKFRGKVELGVRGLLFDDKPVAPPVTESSGRAYMESRLRQETSKRARSGELASIADAIHVRLMESADDSRLRIEVTPRMFMSGSYLIGRDDIQVFLGHLHAVEDEVPAGAQLMCTGPWPPYSFSEIDLRSET